MVFWFQGSRRCLRLWGPRALGHLSHLQTPSLHASQRTEQKDKQLGERTLLHVISLMCM